VDLMVPSDVSSWLETVSVLTVLLTDVGRLAPVVGGSCQEALCKGSFEGEKSERYRKRTSFAIASKILPSRPWGRSIVSSSSVESPSVAAWKSSSLGLGRMLDSGPKS
jgi:hypothetical protein